MKYTYLYSKGFSLIELLTSIAVFTILMVAAVSVINQSQKAWIRSVDRVSQFRDARLAFELMTRNLSQSTLNTYWDYERNNSSNSLTAYTRASELHFFVGKTTAALPGVAETDKNPTHAVFFQAVLGNTNDTELAGLNSLLNSRGYYIDFGDDDFLKPDFIKELPSSTSRRRFRLMEFSPPSENNLIYQSDRNFRSNGSGLNDWFQLDIEEYSRPIVENVIALIISPQSAGKADGNTTDRYDLAPKFAYDSRDESNADTINILPPLIGLTLVVLTEDSARRLEDEFGSSAPNNLIEENWFQDASKLSEDLDELEESFNARKIGFQVFSSTVNVRASKWSR